MSLILRQQIEKIVQLTDEEFEWVLSHFKERTFKKHQIIIQENDYVKYDYFVLNGLLKSSHVNNEGKEYIIQFATCDWWITDPQAFNNKTKATLNIECLENSKTLALTLENKEKMCKELQKIEYFFLKKTIAGYIALQKRILCLISNVALERYNNFLSQYPELTQKIPKSMVASYVGVTRETLSRLSNSVTG